MTKIKKYANKFSFEEILQIFEDYKLFEKQGFIGECTLRKKAKDFVKEENIKDANIVFYMETIVNSCYRLIAEKAMENGFTLKGKL